MISHTIRQLDLAYSIVNSVRVGESLSFEELWDLRQEIVRIVEKLEEISKEAIKNATL